MSRITTTLDADAGSPATTTGMYRSLDEALDDAARAAGSIVTDDILAGRPTVSIKLTVTTEDRRSAAMIEVSAIVTRRHAPAADD